MPLISDDMYCSEQICIPPSFPYLLRQYAKAAIRTQPIDLLKWSTAYFRCLSLNIPPPVKPRLEYPIPRDFHGITPGWLKALIYQLQNNQTVPFKVLWDRWIGACLHHNTLIKILCLGGFNDAEAIPWLRFVALCAGTLTDDLTHTMILICEILTEEPEGGSAMITLETFLDLYQFLAKIDASEDQVLKNFWFRDSLLSLWREKTEKVEAEEEVIEEFIAVSEESVATKTTTESMVKTEEKDDMEKVVSCPSLPEDDHYSIDYLLKEVPGEEALEGEASVEIFGEGGDVDVEVEVEEKLSKEESLVEKEEMSAKGDSEDKSEHVSIKEEEKEESVKDLTEDEPEDAIMSKDVDDVAGDEGQVESVQEIQKVEGVAEEQEKSLVLDEDDVKEYTSQESIQDQRVRDLTKVFEDDATLKEDLERLRALQQELAGETDEEVEKFKCRLIEEMPMTESQEMAIEHFKYVKTEPSSSDEKLKIISVGKMESGDISSESQEGAGDKKSYEEVFVEAIPGIGPVVSEKLIEAVVEYMKNCAKIQHGMVMPRNIRHYTCPPLEALEY